MFLKPKLILIMNNYLFACLIFMVAMPLTAQNNSTASSLLLQGQKEQYKLDNEIREQLWGRLELEWTQTLTNIEKFINSNNQYNQDEIKEWQQNLSDLHKKTDDQLKTTEKNLNTNKLLIEGLGEPPEDRLESASLALTRKQLNHIQTFTTQQFKKITQLSTNVEKINLALSQIKRRHLTDILRTRLVSPFLPDAVISATKIFSAKFTGFFIDLNNWILEHLKSKKLWTAAMIMLFSLIFSLSLSRWISKRYGRNAQNQQPSHTRKLIAALVEGVAKGLLPATIIVVLYFLISTVYLTHSEDFFAKIKIILLHLFVLSIAISLCSVVFSPKKPQWRLTNLSATTSSNLGKGLIFLFTVLILDSFLYRFLNFDASMAWTFTNEQTQAIAFSGSIFNFLEAGGLLYLCRASLWGATNQNVINAEFNTLETLRNLIRSLIILVAIVSIIATCLGYIYFASYIIFGAFITTLVFSIGYMIRQTAHETISYLVKKKWLRKNFGLRIITLQKLKFWADLTIDPLIFGTAILILLPFWGFPIEQVFQNLRSVFNSFSIGQLNISLKGILLSVIVFFAIIKLTRFCQSFIKQNIFTNSQVDLISQHNTLTIINYLGVMIAIGSSIVALGISINTIAIIMGALSVGIGFGLRDVISNYISGILLFLEKPIKVGDWIQIGQHEGFVKDVNFRATELETFQQASVIIPNVDLISLPVINMTFANKKGRIEIAVSVAYKSDPLLVHRLLKEIAISHPLVLEVPEPNVLLMDFAESSLNFELRCFTNNIIDKINIASEIRFQIERIFKDHAIEIPFPQRVLHMESTHKKNTSNIHLGAVQHET